MITRNIGQKLDKDKPDYSLIPPLALDEVVKVLTFGANKYDRHNWKNLENSENRYFAAAQRHVWATQRGEILDQESGLSHLAHAICCLMFMLNNEKNKKTYLQK